MHMHMWMLLMIFPNLCSMSAKSAASARGSVADGDADANPTAPSISTLFWRKLYLFCESKPAARAWSAIPYRFELLLLAIAFTVRFHDLAKPNSVVFDEFFFGKFTNYYFTGHHYFDIHPPLGKLTFALAGKLLGYNASACAYPSIGAVYAPECNYILLRYVSGE